MQGKTKVTIKETINYAKRFSYVLDTGDASPLLTLSPRNKQHAMTALANLAKFTGRYVQFVQIRQNYNLKWSKGDSLQSFEKLFGNDALNYDSMLSRIKEMMRFLPTSMSKIVQFGILVGLRSSEIVESVRLINDKEAFPKYYDFQTMTLSHFKFKQFLRTTKKAYVSFLTPSMLEVVQNLDDVPSYNQIRLACYKRDSTCDLRFTRKIHATHLHQSGIPTEIIDTLQGRTPASIFAKHYYRPSSDYRSKVLDALEKLQRAITTKQP